MYRIKRSSRQAEQAGDEHLSFPSAHRRGPPSDPQKYLGLAGVDAQVQGKGARISLFATRNYTLGIPGLTPRDSV